ncbi:hypothetical protein SH591_04525 [Sphingomonas sp. LY54]|nr:hypothetical protein [Sphingomonas sp. LY54]WRP29451.1 hypothetical protein SH591_04525 [Sphingomonas sp. LY54]
MNMERDKASDEDLPHQDPETTQKGEEAAKHLDEIPPVGTDPLHEGP